MKYKHYFALIMSGLLSCAFSFSMESVKIEPDQTILEVTKETPEAIAKLIHADLNKNNLVGLIIGIDEKKDVLINEIKDLNSNNSLFHDSPFFVLYMSNFAQNTLLSEECAPLGPLYEYILRENGKKAITKDLITRLLNIKNGKVTHCFKVVEEKK